MENLEHNDCQAEHIFTTHILSNVPIWLHTHAQTHKCTQSLSVMYQWLLVTPLQLCWRRLRLCWGPAESGSSWRLPVENLWGVALCLSSPGSACSLFLPASLSAAHYLQKESQRRGWREKDRCTAKIKSVCVIIVQALMSNNSEDGKTIIGKK